IGRQSEQIDSSRGYILSHLPGRYRKASGAQLVVKLGVDQMNLAQIGLIRISRQSGEMLHGRPEVGIAFDAQTGQEADALLVPLTHGVRLAAAHCLNNSLSL